MSSRSIDLPDGWSVCSLIDVADVVMGQSPPGSTYNTDGDGLPFFQGKAEFGRDFPTPRKWCTAPARIAEPGDILMSIRAPVGPTNVADQRCAIGRGLAVIRARHGVPPSLVRHAIKLQENEIASWGTGSTFTAISKRHFGDIQVVLPPEHDREALSDLLDETARARWGSLSRVIALRRVIERFRTAVLVAGCSGRLTGDWRDTHDDGSGKRLAKDLATSNSASRSRTSAARDETEELRTYPDSWGTATFGALTNNYDGRRVPVKSVDRTKRQGPYPYYGASGIIDRIDDFLFEGDYLLVSEDGANLLARSTPIAFRATGQFWVNNHAHVVQGQPGIIDAYLEIVINARDLQTHITGSAQPKLTQAALNGISIPVPSTAEQHEIVHSVVALNTMVDGLEERIEAASRHITNSWQALLAKAFRGELALSTEATL